MKLLSSSLVGLALGQEFYGYDYNYNSDSGRFGSLQVATAGVAENVNLENHGGNANAHKGHGGNKRYCHTTRQGKSIYNWTSHAQGGYFYEGRNLIECIGEELYCFIEERAQFGQIIGILAGCEQMMNHPAVTIEDQQALIAAQLNEVKNNYNQEAARGGVTPRGLRTYFGLGGCLAMPAQNGHEFQWGDNEVDTVGTDSEEWARAKWRNMYRWFHGGFGMNQCLRFPKTNRSSSPYTHYNSPARLLPFGVSVCRACCIAEFTTDVPTSANVNTVWKDKLCNYPPDLTSNINSVTSGEHHELVPRFDMAGVADQFHFESLDTNNLFIHESSGDVCEPGPARGCNQAGVCSGGNTGNTDLCPDP